MDKGASKYKNSDDDTKKKTVDSESTEPKTTKKSKVADEVTAKKTDNSEPNDPKTTKKRQSSSKENGEKKIKSDVKTNAKETPKVVDSNAVTILKKKIKAAKGSVSVLKQAIIDIKTKAKTSGLKKIEKEQYEQDLKDIEKEIKEFEDLLNSLSTSLVSFDTDLTNRNSDKTSSIKKNIAPLPKMIEQLQTTITKVNTILIEDDGDDDFFELNNKDGLSSSFSTALTALNGLAENLSGVKLQLDMMIDNSQLKK